MRSLPMLFSIALFGASLLSFSVQPILGKMLLPMVGGAPAGWIVAMAFFQLALLGGYGISYLLGRFSPWVHAAGLFALYTAGLIFLPPHLPQIPDDAAGVKMSVEVVVALTKSIFVPFLALTATTAALQRVFAATQHATAKDPYYLFVASNIGSFIGLFAYPLVLEPYSGLIQQSQMWQLIYGVVIVLILLALAAAWRYRSTEIRVNEKTLPDMAPDTVSKKQIFQWILLAFIPCSLSMGVTTLITTDIGGLPLFWVMPLGLYLLTFILAFAKKPLLPILTLNFYHIIAVTLMVFGLIAGMSYQPGGAIDIFAMLATALLGGFFIVAWSCHQMLANSRPSTNNLTLFYFLIALGGGLAGLIHAFAIPFLLSDSIEFHVVLLLSVLLLKDNFTKGADKEKITKITRTLLILLLVGIVTVVIAKYLRKNDYSFGYYFLPYVISFMIALLLAIRPLLLCIFGIVVLVVSTASHYPGEVFVKGRNFFGQYAVYEQKTGKTLMRYLAHGNTIHGMEITSNENSQVNANNVSYYARNNPIGEVLTAANSQTVAVIGLGAGQMACYRPGLTIDFYEIDPEIEQVAHNYFSYLKNCPPRDVFIGDGRIALGKQNRLYDVIMLDAFSSDGIPMHLLTTEALQVYVKQLNGKGIVLFHVSNRFLDIVPPLAAVAKLNELKAYQKFYRPVNKNAFDTESNWVAIPVGEDAEQSLVEKGWLIAEPAKTPWTDERSSLLGAIKLPGKGFK